MADTVVHEQVHDDASAGTGILIAFVLLLFLALLIIFGAPILRGISGGSMASQVNVPSQMDVNVHGGAGGSTGGGK